MANKWFVVSLEFGEKNCLNDDIDTLLTGNLERCTHYKAMQKSYFERILNTIRSRISYFRRCNR